MGGVGVALMSAGDGELIIKKGVGFALADFEVGGGIFIHDKFFCFREKSFCGEEQRPIARGDLSAIE